MRNVAVITRTVSNCYAQDVAVKQDKEAMAKCIPTSRFLFHFRFDFREGIGGIEKAFM